MGSIKKRPDMRAGADAVVRAGAVLAQKGGHTADEWLRQDAKVAAGAELRSIEVGTVAASCCAAGANGTGRRVVPTAAEAQCPVVQDGVPRLAAALDRLLNGESRDDAAHALVLILAKIVAREPPGNRDRMRRAIAAAPDSAEALFLKDQVGE